MLRTLLVEDEVLAKKELKKIIAHFPEIEIVAEADTVLESTRLIKEHNPDLLFLDIELKDGYSFAILQQFPNPNFQVIFITAFNQFAIKAFRHSAVDYLLKPVDKNQFVVAIEKAIANKNNKDNSLKLELMMKSIQENQFDKIAVPTIDGIQFVTKNQIMYCESDGNYVVYYFSNNNRLVSTNILKNVEELLFENNFFRLHRSFIVNIDYVKKVIKTGFGAAIMQNEIEIPIARRRRNEFLEKMGM